jgi:hypothetical protein
VKGTGEIVLLVWHEIYNQHKYGSISCREMVNKGNTIPDLSPVVPVIGAEEPDRKR